MEFRGNRFDRDKIILFCIICTIYFTSKYYIWVINISTMKICRILAFILFCFLSNTSALCQAYSVEYSSESYIPLSDATLLDESDPDVVGAGYDLYKAIPIGFTYQFSGNNYDSLRIGELGYASFADGTTEEYFISIFNCLLKDFNDTPSESPIYYETSGELGNRIFKCDFIKKGFLFDTDNDDYINFQLWLYESCNNFEVRIGEISIDPLETDLYFSANTCAGIGYGKYSPTNNFFLSGSPTTPIIVEDDGLAALITEPDPETVYLFSNCSLALDAIEEKSFEIFPNPANESVFIKFNALDEVKEIELINAQGQIINAAITKDINLITFDTSDLQPGIYFVQMSLKKSIISKKLIIQ